MNANRRLPMRLPELRAEIDLPDPVSACLDDLIARKRQTKEMGSGARIELLDQLIKAEFIAARERAGRAPAPPAGLVERANNLFRSLLLG